MTESEAIAVAKQIAEHEGWPWDEPVSAVLERRFILLGPKEWTVTTNATLRGCNLRIVLDARTGAVLIKHRLPR